MGEDNMGKVKVVSKGYTLVVESYEGDGDNPSTDRIMVEDLEVAKAFGFILETLFSSGDGIGNMARGYSSKRSADKIHEFIRGNTEVIDTFMTYLTDDKWESQGLSPVDSLMDFSMDVLGHADVHVSRVCEHVNVYYSPEDLHWESVEIN